QPSIGTERMFGAVAADGDDRLGSFIEAGGFFRQSFRIDCENPFWKTVLGMGLKRERCRLGLSAEANLALERHFQMNAKTIASFWGFEQRISLGCRGTG